MPPDSIPPADASHLTQLSEVDLLKMTLFQERVNGVGLRMGLIQKEMEALQAEQATFVKTHIRPTYHLEDGDQIDIRTGKITRKGDPNLTITRPKLAEVPAN